MARTRRSNHLRRAVEDVKRTARTVADAARAESGAGHARIDVKQHTNLVVVAHLGESRSTTVATHEQHVPIRQDRAASPSTDEAGS